ncbi:type II toxin-antitoxin system RelE/ParE family toxin [Williamsia sp. 1135]|uniref:type II toxin-antitoxin system RelE/ParE family toxin n=1 Tax=Williamsia sp. 1135 TaxID=1889262 RepID=UPI000A10641A|nr:type II toxin-antitoxin system RelE/ParE family toxin [Williamsia sp. 1135]ORM38248.1 hypothetical protein BFL43_00505 [Williamsia sp. 1135]
MWTVILLDEVDEWFIGLDSDTSESVADAIDELESKGPLLGRPLADRIKGSKLHNLKELRPPATNVRILFIFDPQRQAVLLAAGDKTGQWAKWYTDNIPKAERRYQDWLDATPTRQEE